MKILVDQIFDPDDFIRKIRSSYAIKQFTAHFTGPNPIDADELFQKPLSVYCQAINGSDGKVVIKGHSLDSSLVADVAKSTAATGNDATARIMENEKEKVKTISLRGNPVKISIDSEKLDDPFIELEILKSYSKVRNNYDQ